jgi:hypothetical protein
VAQQQRVPLGAVVDWAVGLEVSADPPQGEQDGQTPALLQVQALLHQRFPLGQVAGVEQGQVAQERRFPRTRIAQDHQARIGRQRFLDADGDRLGVRAGAVLWMSQRRFAGSQCLAGGEIGFLLQPGSLGLDRALARGAEGDVYLLQLNMHQLAAGADALEPQVAVTADDVAQVVGQRGIRVTHHRGVDGQLAVHDGHVALGDDDVATHVFAHGNTVLVRSDRFASLSCGTGAFDVGLGARSVFLWGAALHTESSIVR